jgi:arabinose-5-phosphate isomerase
MLALGDAVALVLSRMRSFGALDFVRFHPGGSLGRKLAKVDDLMRPLDECRVAPDHKTVREVFVEVSRPGRRSGAIMLTDETGLLTGIFTDSDLARLLETRRDRSIDGPIRDVMTRGPRAVRSGSPMGEALDVLAERKISELPVIDADGRPLGMLDITDVVGLLPREVPAADSPPTASSDDSDNPATVPLAGSSLGRRA